MPAVIRVSVITPMVFCASLVPWARATIDADTVWAALKPRPATPGSAWATTRMARYVAVIAIRAATTGESTAGRTTLLSTVEKSIAPAPPATQVAPISPPNSACEELEGSPRSQVTRFHTIAPISPAKMTTGLMSVSSTRPPEMVFATWTDRKAPSTFRQPAIATAVPGRNAPVAIDVAIAFAVSWKPFVKSKTNAVTTTTTTISDTSMSPAPRSAGGIPTRGCRPRRPEQRAHSAAPTMPSGTPPGAVLSCPHRTADGRAYEWDRGHGHRAGTPCRRTRGPRGMRAGRAARAPGLRTAPRPAGRARPRAGGEPRRGPCASPPDIPRQPSRRALGATAGRDHTVPPTRSTAHHPWGTSPPPRQRRTGGSVDRGLDVAMVRPPLIPVGDSFGPATRSPQRCWRWSLPRWRTGWS